MFPSRPHLYRFWVHLESSHIGKGAIFLGAKRPGCEADPSPSYSAEINIRSYISATDIFPQISDNFT